MASYEELYNMIIEESVKGTTGRAVLKTIDTGKKVGSEVKKVYDTVSDKVSTGYNKAKETKVVGPVIKGAEKASTLPFTATSSAAANAITKSKEVYIRKKYANDPEKLESELKKNVDKLDSLKSDIMALEIWTVGWPLAIKSAGVLDNVFKGIIGAGAMAKGDKELITAVAKATMWVPTAALTISKILKKEVTGDEAIGFIKKITTKVLNTLESWAKSDQPLFVAKKGPALKSSKFVKKEETVKESVSLICESIINEEITYEEAAFLMESII